MGVTLLTKLGIVFVVKVDGDITDKLIDDFCALLDVIYRTQTRFRILYDLTDLLLNTVSMKHTGRVIRFMNDKRDIAEQRIDKVGIIVNSNDIMKNVLTTLFKLSPSRVPVGIYNTFDDGVEKVCCN
jgi:hypothetical protein